MTRQVVLNIQTTGVEVEYTDRIIEIAAIELNNGKPTGNEFYSLVHPENSEITAEALAIHGLEKADLQGQPTFKEIAKDLMDFIDPDNKHAAELIVHHFPFTSKFIDYEMFNINKNWTTILNHCSRAIDTLEMGRKLHPNREGNSNSLDALCERYRVENPRPNICDAENRSNLVMQVYLKMVRELEKRNKKEVEARKNTLFAPKTHTMELRERSEAKVMRYGK